MSTIEALNKGVKKCSKLILKTPERRHWHHSGVFIVKFWTHFTPVSRVFIVEFKQVNVSWVDFQHS